jgi:hypothetical protein
MAIRQTDFRGVVSGYDKIMSRLGRGYPSLKIDQVPDFLQKHRQFYFMHQRIYHWVMDSLSPSDYGWSEVGKTFSPRDMERKMPVYLVTRVTP